MVEGHSVHRVATRMHDLGLIGKRFVATSPNGRFTDGASAISNEMFYDIQAIGKNLFAFFGTAEAPTVVHIHFGMAGAWAIFQASEDVPEPSKTNRLRLVNAKAKLTADLSAMTVQYGGMDLYEEKRNALGSDPLRSDADPEGLWNRVSKSKKSIGSIIMDQSYFAGPGNIYRAEILFKAGIHPDTPGDTLERHQFDEVWKHTVDLMRRGYTTGSILTVDPAEAERLGRPELRRYIYNAKRCPRCQSNIQTWAIQNRTCYACLTCQPPWNKLTSTATTVPHEPFRSHCAPEPSVALSNMTVKELKAYLIDCHVDYPRSSRKHELVELAEQSLVASRSRPAVVTPPRLMVSAEEAAAEKGAAGESLAVEHIAELAPSQARRARKRVKRKL